MYYTLYAIIMLGNVSVFNGPLHVDVSKEVLKNQQRFAILCSAKTKQLRDSLKDTLELESYKGIKFTCYGVLEYDS